MTDTAVVDGQTVKVVEDQTLGAPSTAGGNGGSAAASAQETQRVADPNAGGGQVNGQSAAETQAATQPPVKEVPAGQQAAQTQQPSTTAAPAGITEERAQVMIQEALKNQQAGYDRRITSLTGQVESERQRAAQAEAQRIDYERQHKLGDPTLTPEQKKALEDTFAIEDERNKLATWQGELETYHRTLQVASLVEEFGSYGVTADALEDYETPEEMEAFALETKANALEAQVKNGGASATTTAPAAQQTTAPAGATQTSDAGGGGAASRPPEYRTDQGGDALAANLAKTPWERVKLPY